MLARVSAEHLTEFHVYLHRWYKAHGRKNLPWRNTTDPYAIYLSEIMLQQTQVKTVLERFYSPFMQRFPTLAALAAAPQQDVLQAWQGLGYYTRALNLHTVAKQCPEGLPATVDTLVSLPGIGRNTAHAIVAFAYRQAHPVMEANVKRVISRLFQLSHPTERELWERAEQLLDTQEPFDYNQAMMDLGAMVCTKNSPQCSACPARIICQGYDTPEHYPAPKITKPPPVRRKKIAVLRNNKGNYYATPRESRFLQGMYHFVELEADSVHFVFEGNRYALGKAEKRGQLRQQYSHFTLDAEIYLIDLNHSGNVSETGSWHSTAELKMLPMSMAEQKIIGFIEEFEFTKI